jgi:hypothetical protein
MKTLLALGSMALACTAVLLAQTKLASDGEIQIKQLERAWNQAEAKHDVGAEIHRGRYAELRRF